MGSLDVVLVGLLRGVDFEDTNLAAIFLCLCWEQADYAWFFGKARFLNFCGCSKVFLQVLRMNLDFSQAIQHRISVRYVSGWLIGGLTGFCLFYSLLPVGLIMGFFVLSLLILYARIQANAHTPEQVVAGYLLGIAGTFIPNLIYIVYA